MGASPTAVAAWLKQSGTEIESVIRGQSMQPTLADGTRIRIRCGSARCEPGDIIAFLVDPLIAHRVVAHARRGSRRYVITRGDALWSCDAPVREDQILGVVTARHDGTSWQPPGTPKPPTGWRSVLIWLSRWSIHAALMAGERVAIGAAVLYGAIAARSSRRG